MLGSRSARKRLWRWRSNPLRRRDDIIEAWIVLGVWTAIAVGGTFAGLVTAHAASEVFAQQRAERHSVRAVLLNDVPRSTSATWRTSVRVPATVRWTAPDGTTHSGRTLVNTRMKAGTKVVTWQDNRGRLTPEPTGATDAAIEAGLLGTGAAFALTGAALGVAAAVRWRLDQRRIDQWGREWDLVGPRWGDKTG